MQAAASIRLDRLVGLSLAGTFFFGGRLATRPTLAAASEEAMILTPKPPETPRINGAKIFGVRPGHPFLFTIPATGRRPRDVEGNINPNKRFPDMKALTAYIHGRGLKAGIFRSIVSPKKISLSRHSSLRDR